MAESLCAHRNKLLPLRKASLSTAFGHESKRDVFSISQGRDETKPKNSPARNSGFRWRKRYAQVRHEKYDSYAPGCPTNETKV